MAPKYGLALLIIFVLCAAGFYGCTAPSTPTLEPITDKPPASTTMPTAERLPVTTPAMTAIPTVEKLPVYPATATSTAEKLPVSTPTTISTVEKIPVFPATSTVAKLPPVAAQDTVMVLITQGEFLMGAAEADKNAGSDEKPQHMVFLSDYYIDSAEVTNSLYQACVEAGVCTLPQERTSYIRENYYGNPDFDSYPVIQVDWNQARTYCEWRGARLPTEAEWEKAARGTDGRIFPWGISFESRLTNFCDKNCPLEWADNNSDDGYPDTSPAESFPGGASPYGLLNMAGNVYEWVQDWYQETYYLNSPYENPLGPSTGVLHIVRGGSWSDGSNGLRASYRSSNAPADYSGSIGFRCAYSP